jgi:hypothetical protein
MRLACLGPQNTTMLRLKPRQRELFVDKMPDVANVAAASMFFAQFLNDRPFSVWLGLAGLAAWLMFWTLAFVAARGEE